MWTPFMKDITVECEEDDEMELNNQKIINLVGASGSGKTTIAKELEKKGYNIIKSHTTREPREENEWGHTFVGEVEVNEFNGKFELEYVDDPAYGNIYHPVYAIAYKEIYGDHYWATKEQYQGKGTSIYIVDPDGARQVKENVKDAEVITIFLMADKIIRRERIAKRNNIKLGHSAKEHFELQEDTERLKEYFTILQEIQGRVTKDKEIFKTCKCDYVVDANRELEEVLKDVIEVIEGEI